MSDKEKTVKDILLDVFCKGLSASNSADGKELEKQDDDKPAENGKAKNEDDSKEPDYKKLYEDLKAKVEAGNCNGKQAKNEEEPKKEPEKPAENEDDDDNKEPKAENKKAKNSIDVDEVVNKILTAVNGEPQPAYESRADRIEAGNKY